MRAIAVVNQKGGCGKTTTAINLAAVFARRGARTLLVDLDPQSHCAAGLAVPEHQIEHSVGEALVAAHDQSFDPRNYVWEVSRNLHLLPSTTRLAAMEAPGGPLHQLPDRDRRLEGLLTLLSPRYDFCLIDCPPTIGLLTFNALRAAREALIPVETGFFSLRGAQKQWKTIQRLIDHIERPLVCHLLPTLHDTESENARNVLAALKREFGSQLLPVVIHDHESLREAASYGQPVVEYAPGSDAERDFDALADWLEERAVCAPTIEVFAQGSPSFAERGFAGGLSDFSVRMSCSPRAPDPGGEGECGRAAELARRIREITHHPLQEHASPSPSHRYGAIPINGGVRFVQPGDVPRSIFIAGDFNNWSASATPLRYNFESGEYEATVILPPGRYEYRLVIDGEWRPDQYNAAKAEFGRETSSVFEVQEAFRGLQEAR